MHSLAFDPFGIHLNQIIKYISNQVIKKKKYNELNFSP